MYSALAQCAARPRRLPGAQGGEAPPSSKQALGTRLESDAHARPACARAGAAVRMQPASRAARRETCGLAAAACRGVYGPVAEWLREGLRGQEGAPPRAGSAERAPDTTFGEAALGCARTRLHAAAAHTLERPLSAPNSHPHVVCYRVVLTWRPQYLVWGAFHPRHPACQLVRARDLPPWRG